MSRQLSPADMLLSSLQGGVPGDGKKTAGNAMPSTADLQEAVKKQRQAMAAGQGMASLPLGMQGMAGLVQQQQTAAGAAPNAARLQQPDFALQQLMLQRQQQAAQQAAAQQQQQQLPGYGAAGGGVPKRELDLASILSLASSRGINIQQLTASGMTPQQLVQALIQANIIPANVALAGTTNIGMAAGGMGMAMGHGGMGHAGAAGMHGSALAGGHPMAAAMLQQRQQQGMPQQMALQQQAQQRQQQQPQQPRDRERERDKPSSGPTIKEMLEVGLFPPNRPNVTVTYRGNVTTATITRDGNISWNNQSFPSDTAFSAYVKRVTLQGMPDDGKLAPVLVDDMPLSEWRQRYLEAFEGEGPEEDDDEEFIPGKNDRDSGGSRGRAKGGRGRGRGRSSASSKPKASYAKVQARQEEAEDDEEGTDQWVQCSRCNAWRIVPDDFWPDIQEMEDENWYCKDALWDVTTLAPFSGPCQ